jgi:ABC-type uncharacterized transport system permease subunit
VLSGISVVCFASSYGVAMLLELTRFFIRTGIRNAVMIGFAAAGLFAHSVFLGFLVRGRWQQGLPLTTWYTGCLSLAWAMVAVYLLTVLSHQRSTAGLLLLPTSLALIAASHLFPQASGSVRLWSVVHGLSLAVGTALVVVGFLAGVMYLIQSYRLKNKLPPRSAFWLPSLEWLQRLNERALYSSIALLGVGIITGILLNLIRSGSQAVIPWSDPVVLASLVWLAWLTSIAVFNAVYRPARHGRKVAYETVVSFLFLSLVLGIILLTPSAHGSAAGLGAAAVPQRRPPSQPVHSRVEMYRT